MRWFQEHRLLTLYLVASTLWAVWNVTRAGLRTRRLSLGSALIVVVLAPILMPLTLLGSKRDPAWMDLRWKCPNCAWAMFTEECEECGAPGLPYDPVAGRVIDENEERRRPETS